MKVIINDLILDAENYNFKMTTSEPTGSSLLRISFNASVTGKSNQDKLEEVLSKKIFNVKIEEENIEIRAKLINKNYSYKYDSSKVNEENRIYKYDIIIKEIDKDLPDNWNSIAVIKDTVIMNWIRTRAIGNLLIEKGLFTEKEYIDKIEELTKKDFDNLKKYIAYGITETKGGGK